MAAHHPQKFLLLVTSGRGQKSSLLHLLSLNCLLYKITLPQSHMLHGGTLTFTHQCSLPGHPPELLVSPTPPEPLFTLLFSAGRSQTAPQEYVHRTFAPVAKHVCLWPEKAKRTQGGEIEVLFPPWSALPNTWAPIRQPSPQALSTSSLPGTYPLICPPRA